MCLVMLRLEWADGAKKNDLSFVIPGWGTIKSIQPKSDSDLVTRRALATRNVGNPHGEKPTVFMDSSRAVLAQ